MEKVGKTYCPLFACVVARAMDLRARQVATRLFATLRIAYLGTALVLSACAFPPWGREAPPAIQPTSGGESAAGAIGVASIATPPEVARHARQMTHDEGAMTGFLSGGGAGASAGAATCAPSSIAGPLYGYFVALFGMLGAGVGAVGGYAAVEAFTTEPANWLLPDLVELPVQFRHEVLRNLAVRLGGPPQDLCSIAPGSTVDRKRNDKDDETAVAERSIAGTASEPADPYDALRDRDMSAVLEIELIRARAVITRFGNYKFSLTARSRLRSLAAQGDGDDEDFSYRSPKIKGQGDRNTDAASMRDAVAVALRELSEQIIARHFPAD